MAPAPGVTDPGWPAIKMSFLLTYSHASTMSRRLPTRGDLRSLAKFLLKMPNSKALLTTIA